MNNRYFILKMQFYVFNFIKNYEAQMTDMINRVRIEDLGFPSLQFVL